MTLYLFKNFNNYYNRIVKKHNAIAEYGNPLAVIPSFDFYCADGVSTSIVVDVSWETGVPDYMVVVDDNGNISSRWYIIEAALTRGEQYRLSCYHDLVADWYDDIMTAPCYVEKGWVSTSDPAIYNMEELSTNQIKTSEHLLKDRTDCPWIVGYLARNAGDINVTIPEDPIKVDFPDGKATVPFYENIYENPFIGPISKQAYKFPVYFNESDLLYFAHWDANGDGNGAPIADTDRVWASYLYTTSAVTSVFINTAQTRDDLRSALSSAAKNVDWNTIPLTNYWPDVHNSVDTETFLDLNGKVVLDGGKYYRIRINYGANAKQINYRLGRGSALYNAILEVADEAVDVPIPADIAYLDLQAPTYYISYEQISVNTLSTTLQSNHLVLNDAPYDMFCMPYGAVSMLGITTDATTSMRIAQGITEAAGSNLFDLQLLPYCPLPQNAIGEASIDLSQISGSTGKITSPITANDIAVGYVIWCTSSSFALTIDHSISVPADSLSFKVANQCDKYRLSSPNYNGQFEFTATRNQGISRFTVDCTYRPHTPYIRVAPDFGGLYGRDFDDARGLVCGGDFSLPIISDAWTQYQINNKNYNNIFDRQIENLEFMQKQERTSSIVNAITGGIGGAATGVFALGGAGPVAAGIGAGVGAAAGIGGGVADVLMLEERQRETLDYTRDQYNMSLQNIQAMPQSLTRVSAYNANNKLFPFVEYYTATETEKQALRDKITYNGMTINRIGTLSSFVGPNTTYLKGKLIRLTNIDEEYHIATTIANEINRGIFI